MKIPFLSPNVTETINHLDDLTLGIVRARSYRWHGKVSVYNYQRVYQFLTSISESDSVSKRQYLKLKAEIPQFELMLGTKLSKELNTLFAVTNAKASVC